VYFYLNLFCKAGGRFYTLIVFKLGISWLKFLNVNEVANDWMKIRLLYCTVSKYVQYQFSCYFISMGILVVQSMCFYA
jgi:hypothetical protein